MPKATEFRQAAGILRGDMEIAQSVERTVRQIALVDGVGVNAGPYVDTTIRGVMAGAINAGTVATASFDAATEFDRRAAVCDQYTTDIRDYRSRQSTWQRAIDTYWANKYEGEYAYWPGNGPSEPVKEAIWVEEG